jgi:hypothetical protein
MFFNRNCSHARSFSTAVRRNIEPGDRAYSCLNQCTEVAMGSIIPNTAVVHHIYSFRSNRNVLRTVVLTSRSSINFAIACKSSRDACILYIVACTPRYDHVQMWKVSDADAHPSTQAQDVPIFADKVVALEQPNHFPHDGRNRVRKRQVFSAGCHDALQTFLGEWLARRWRPCFWT